MKIDFRKHADELFTDVFYKLRAVKTDYCMNYGGAGSSKSYSAAQIDLIDIFTKPGNILWFRKKGTTIEESCFKLFDDLIKDYGLTDLFEVANSPIKREFRLKGADRKIYFKGLDDKDKLKSMVGVRKVVMEEGDQFIEDDFLEIDRRLRDFDETELWMNLNPTSAYLWQKKLFIDGGEYQDDITIIHSTYLDNPFLSAKYIKKLLRLKNVNPVDYDVYVDGKWGVHNKDGKFAWAFDPQKHMRACQGDKSQILYLSFDFNVDPITCLAIQMDETQTKVKCIEQIKLANSDIYKLCARIRSTYSNYVLIVTGDATGRARSAMVKDQQNYYKIIKNELLLNDGQIRVPKINPPLESNRIHVNAVLLNCDVSIDPENCEGLEFDLRYVEVGADGKIMKDNRTNKKRQADCLDNLRYFVNSFMPNILTQTNVKQTA